MEVRKQVWSIWKDYLLSEDKSKNLQELSFCNLTRRELMELAFILQTRQEEAVHHIKPLKVLRIKGHMSFETLIQFVEYLGSHKHTRCLGTQLDITLWNGDELHANQSLTKLAQAMTYHYGIKALNIVCAEYSATPNANVLKELVRRNRCRYCY